MRSNKLNVKSTCLLIISYYEKTEDGMIKIDEKIVKCRRKELEESLNGKNFSIEYVSEKPEKIQLGAIYILKTPHGRPDHIYTHQLNG